MEFKGTKGDWSIEETKTQFKISGGSWEDFCRVHKITDGSDYGGDFLEMAKANSKLIAAAPKLLSALQELIQVKQWKEEYGKDKQYLNAMPKAWKNAQDAVNDVFW